MPKNKGLGGKKRRKGKVTGFIKKELVVKDVGQEYAQVVKSLGGCYMELKCFTNGGYVIRRGHIRGKMRKREWLSTGDIVLVNIRDYQDSTCDILLKYSADEARLLRSRNAIPEISDVTCETEESIAPTEKILFVDDEKEPDNQIKNEPTNEYGSINKDLDWCTHNPNRNLSNSESENSLESSDSDDYFDW